jgi:uncharacterized membrane protein
MMPSDANATIDVGVAASVAFDWWTRFEDLPLFIADVDEVWRLDPERLRWITSVGGVHEEWNSVIIEQRPAERIAWRADGKGMSGLVEFCPLDEASTRVSVRISWEPRGASEKIGDATGDRGSDVPLDLHRFKDLVERVGYAGSQVGTATGHGLGDDRQPSTPADATPSEDRARMPVRPEGDVVPPPTW